MTFWPQAKGTRSNRVNFTRITDNEAFSGWVSRMKQRSREKPKAGQVASNALAAAKG